MEYMPAFCFDVNFSDTLWAPRVSQANRAFPLLLSMMHILLQEPDFPKTFPSVLRVFWSAYFTIYLEGVNQTANKKQWKMVTEHEQMSDEELLIRSSIPKLRNERQLWSAIFWKQSNLCLWFRFCKSEGTEPRSKSRKVHWKSWMPKVRPSQWGKI